jgi:geranylgeranyl diphosphate synthase type II
MIELKTAVLIGCSMEIGAILAGLNEANCKKLYEAGVAAGIGFQIQDDYLDAFADQAQFGKEIGGDIKSRKKTFLVLKAQETMSVADKTLLDELYNSDRQRDVVSETLEIFERNRIKDVAKEEADKYLKRAINLLHSLEDANLGGLISFIERLYQKRLVN